MVCFAGDWCGGPSCLPGGADSRGRTWRLWHTDRLGLCPTPGELLPILDGWPTEGEILAGYRRITLII